MFLRRLVIVIDVAYCYISDERRSMSFDKGFDSYGMALEDVSRVGRRRCKRALGNFFKQERDGVDVPRARNCFRKVRVKIFMCLLLIAYLRT